MHGKHSGKPPSGKPPSHLALPSVRAHLRYARLRVGRWPPRFLRHSRPALARFALLACCVRSGAARPQPLSRGRSGVFALASLAAPGPRPFPPAVPLGRLCAASPLRGRSLAPSAFGPGRAALRASCSVALATLGLGPCAARGPPGPPLAVRFAASGPACSSPGGRRPNGRPFSPPPGASFARVRLRPLRFSVVVLWPRFVPLRCLGFACAAKQLR